jgi:hypothetical protein
VLGDVDVEEEETTPAQFRQKYWTTRYSVTCRFGRYTTYLDMLRIDFKRMYFRSLVLVATSPGCLISCTLNAMLLFNYAQ